MVVGRGGLLLAEYLFLSFLVDLPIDGPALPLAQAVRLAVPVVLSATAASWLLNRSNPRAAPDPTLALPAWRPLPALAVQPLVFGAAAFLASRVLDKGAPVPETQALLPILALLLASVALAVHGAAPLPWVLQVSGRRWSRPLLAVGLGLLAWRAAGAAESLWGTLSSSTLGILGIVMQVLPYEVSVDPLDRVIGVGDFFVRVAPICSGADGLGLVALFQASWLSLARARLRFPRALLVLPLGMAAAFAGNIVRIGVLLWAGASGHEGIAEGGLHSKLGWLLFLGIALGSVFVAERWDWLRKPGSVVPEADLPASTVFYLAPLMITIAAALLTSAVSADGFDPLYGVRIVAAVVLVLALRRGLPVPMEAPALVALGIGLAVGVGWVLIDAPSASQMPAALAALTPVSRWSWILIRAAGSCAVIPVVEELAFRGFLLRWLVAPDFEKVRPASLTLLAVVLSSLAFGATHDSFVLGAVAGLAFTAAWAVRGRLLDAVFAHAVANTVVAAAVLGFDRWSLWS